MFRRFSKYTKLCSGIPLRYVLLTFGYVNVVLSSFVFGLLIWTAVDLVRRSEYLDEGYLHFEFELPILMYFMGIISNVLLVIAAHRENETLFKVYFYYGVLTTVALFISLVMIVELITKQYLTMNLITFFVAFLGIAFQIYLLVLVKTQIIRLRNNQQLRFVNHIIDDLNQPSDELI